MRSIHPKRLLKELEAEFDLELKRAIFYEWKILPHRLVHGPIGIACLPINPKTP